MNMDKMEIEILEDGTIKTTTGKVSGPNHGNAESFLKFMARMTDGKLAREKRTPHSHHGHTHGQGQEHSH